MKHVLMILLVVGFCGCSVRKRSTHRYDPLNDMEILDAEFQLELRRSGLVFGSLKVAEFEGPKRVLAEGFARFEQDQGKEAVRSIVSYVIQDFEGSEGEGRRKAILNQIRTHGWKYVPASQGGLLRGDLSTGEDWLALEPSEAALERIQGFVPGDGGAYLDGLTLKLLLEVEAVVQPSAVDASINVGLTLHGSEGRIRLSPGAGPILHYEAVKSALRFYEDLGLDPAP